nr:MAG TPA: hypothetical protein [Caudoviricetes sp.]
MFKNSEIKRVIDPGIERTVKACPQNPITSAGVAEQDLVQVAKRKPFQKKLRLAIQVEKHSKFWISRM